MSDASLRSLIALAVLLGLASVLIWMLPADALARPVFQSPLTDQPATSTPTRPATAAPSATIAVTITSSPTATVVAAATTPPQVDSPAAAPPAAPNRIPGFLPPPTLSASGPPPLIAGGDRSAAAPATATPALRPAPTGTPAAALSPARLIDLGILALSYLWLGCGVLALVAATLILVWVARGHRRGG